MLWRIMFKKIIILKLRKCLKKIGYNSDISDVRIVQMIWLESILGGGGGGTNPESYSKFPEDGHLKFGLLRISFCTWKCEKVCAVCVLMFIYFEILLCSWMFWTNSKSQARRYAEGKGITLRGGIGNFGTRRSCKLPIFAVDFFFNVLYKCIEIV